MAQGLQLLLVLGIAGVPIGASSQTASSDPAFPSKPIRLVVPFPAGATPDIQGRMLTDRLAQQLGRPVVVENRGGANGVIGMEFVARAPADGHTLIIATIGTWAVHPYLYNLPYDILKDFAPVIHVATTPGVLLVHPSLPVKTVKELVALAKQRAGQINYSSAGVGGWFHISTELFAFMTNIKLTHVPYRGNVEALTGVMGGHVHLMINTPLVTASHIQSGRVRALATTGARRAATLPDLPTIAEAGVPGYEGDTWTAIGAPAHTPRPVLERLNKEIAAILQTSDIQQRYAAGGSTVTGGTPEQFYDFLKSELTKYGKLVKEVGIKGE